MAKIPTMSAADALQLFRQYFGAEPDVVASAPGRANLIGEHVDYCGGIVLPVALGVRTSVAVRALPARSPSRAVSAHGSEGATRFEPLAPRATGRWTDFLCGVAHLMAARGQALPPLEIAVVSDVPVGAGLSSSAALAVAAAVAFDALAGGTSDRRETALLAQRAERDFVGNPCGIMDQFASALGEAGQALAIDCHALTTEQIPFTGSLLLIDSGARRALVASAYRQRVAECDEALAAVRQLAPETRDLASATADAVEAAPMRPEVRRRARHVVGEMSRVRRAIAALRDGGALDGALLSASHASLRDLYECSTTALDWLVRDACAQRGVTGARLTGAGWGGCVVAVGDDDSLHAAAPAVARAFAREFGREPRWWVQRAADGATLDAACVTDRR